MAAGTGYEIGWIAWGIGILAGVGMLFGRREEGEAAGMAAAVFSLAGIMAAKAMIFFDVLCRRMGSSAGKETTNSEAPRVGRWVPTKLLADLP